ncbi:aminotransferase class III-fold pyridoxal phosphate-dependent enzyme [Pseudomonas benzenivorans]|uniref:Aminotransferase class III-fold pyridoxal phosphate-dependent enzyme n=1 Tax=Pseudomonas benzenivorans TaxID=556533 RepID=A0ABZ0PR08_9PSED|nr:aminotransferase class III-fold pyridoxal phosphate-dependent enzyme [Pseudomonas benzenivorans]WPC03306.1 aminotransferase class III-fold pyridoxal phosphate-dependent enzyme [Pseudomonas benzenivorans]
MNDQHALTESARLAALLAAHYGLQGDCEPLPGEHDLNYRVRAGDGQQYLLKLHAADGEPQVLAMQVAVLEHLARVAPHLPVSRQLPSQQGGILNAAELRGPRQARLLSWLDGTLWAKAQARTAASSASLGRLLGELDLALQSFGHAGCRRAYDWDIGRAEVHLDHLAAIDDADKRGVVQAILERFVQVVKPALAGCPRQVIHNDANDYNVLLDEQGAVSGLLDFGDMVESWRINELAVACAYALIGADDPVATILALVEAYHEVNPLQPDEAELLFDLIKTRYAVSICMAARQIRETPDNPYLLVSQADVWRELQRLERENSRLVTLRIRDACGFAPVPEAAAVMRWLERNAHDFAPLLRPAVTAPRVRVFDFSAASSDSRAIEGLDCAGMQTYIEAQIAAAGADFGVGRYGERRGLYSSAAYAGATAQQRRDTHLGVDLFAPAGEAVHAPFAGVVAFFHDDAEDQGFGPTLLLEHRSDCGARFWTLYGHLSRASCATLRVGQALARGEAFARLGERTENGGWPTHLHFQLVTDHLGLQARMYGVGVAQHWQVWRAVSPDPSVVLGLHVPCAVKVERSKDWLVRQRHRRIGRSLSIAYGREPLKIVGGEGAYLIDEQGKRWLDMVNNVCHVGHCHPRVVQAAQAQQARLNTNARYLHDSLVEYAERLTALLPEPLNVCFFVNSGSEANDLAIRLARAYTGQRDLITVDHAYHGHLSSLIDVSPYKFNGQGGAGKPEHVWVSELPDPYRGRFRYSDPEAGAKYAEDVARQVAAMAERGRKPALFFSEGILGTGGQLVAPPGYLQAAYSHVRAAGGLCLADEVQVGFGRVGSHMWAFETQGVVPDIVTLGKPIGNGHPMAAVITTAEIANAFANGMEYFNTFGGNPVSAEIGLAVLDVIRDERLMHRCAVLGEQLMAGVRGLAQKYPIIGDVRGIGLFIGIELVRDRQTLEPAAAELEFIIGEMKREHGILLSSEGPLHNVMKIKPPASFSAQNCEQFLAALDRVLASLP